MEKYFAHAQAASACPEGKLTYFEMRQYFHTPEAI